MQKISNHFTLEELTHSSTALKHGICNEPPIEAISNLQNLCQEVLEPLRQHFDTPIHISSGYRCPQLNKLVQGAAHSQHLTGEAADIRLPSVATGKEWYQWMAHNLDYDQLILERNRQGYWWIHVSCRKDPHYNRHSAFLLVK